MEYIQALENASEYYWVVFEQNNIWSHSKIKGTTQNQIWEITNLSIYIASKLVYSWSITDRIYIMYTTCVILLIFILFTRMMNH